MCVLQNPSIVAINPCKGQLRSYSTAANQNETGIKCITKGVSKGQKVRTGVECYKTYKTEWAGQKIYEAGCVMKIDRDDHNVG